MLNARWVCATLVIAYCAHAQAPVQPAASPLVSAAVEDAGPAPIEADESPAPSPPEELDASVATAPGEATTPPPSPTVDVAVGDAGQPEAPVDAGVPLPPGAEVRVGDTLVFTLHAPRGPETPAQRARTANEVLQEAVEAPQPADVRVEHAGSVSIIYVGAAPVVQLTNEDAVLAGDASLTVHADRVAAELRQALKEERQRSAVAATIFNFSLAVLFVVVAVFLLRRGWQLGDRAEQWLETNPERVPAVKLRTVEVLNRGTVRGLLSLAVGAGRWIVLVGLVYAWLIATFSLFDATRGLTEQLSGALITPLASLASRLAAGVPLIVVLGFAALTLALVLRAIRLFFGEVAAGTTTVGWLPKDLAAPTGVLAQLGVVVLGLVLIAPVITGDPDGAFTRMGLVLLVAFGLASVPVVATLVVGAVTLFGRRLKVGDWVELGPRMGRVVTVGLLETTLRDTAGVEVRVPHLLRLGQPTRVHGPTPRVTAALTIDRALATPALATNLERALGSLGTSAVVRLTGVEPTQVTLELTLSSAAADARSAMLWLAIAEVEAARQGKQ